MKKRILLLLAVFSFVALVGGTYLAYSLEHSLSDVSNIIMLHHVENLREHMLLDIQRLKIDLYAEQSRNPESAAAIEGHTQGLEKSIADCYGCHHAADVNDRLDDLRQQIGQYKSAMTAMIAARSGPKRSYGEQLDAQLIGDSLLGKVETMVVSTSEKLKEQTEESLRRAHAAKTLMLVLLAAGPLMMIAFAVSVIRGVGAPVQTLLNATRSLKKGDLGHRVVGLKDEFGELAVAFNDMAGALSETMAAIEESEKKYRLLFEGAADSIFILEAEGPERGRILEVNKAGAEMHGYTIDEMQTMKIQDLDTPQAAEAVPARIERIINGEWIKIEIEHRRKDGTFFPVEVSAGLLETAGHKFILAVDRDLTERKQAEKELQRLERIRVAGEVATGLAHEIKNPLAGIMVSMEVFSEESYLTDEDRNVLNRVIDEIKRIDVLVQALLNFARPPQPLLTPTNVNTVIESVASLVFKEYSRMRRSAGEVRLALGLQKDIPQIMADPMQLKQVFMNLMKNALDAMPDGGTLTIGTLFDSGKNALRIELSDTGRGIAPSVMAKIFNPFFTTKAKGTGLGLSITKRLIEDHGGSIHLENNPDGGATCRISLPVFEPEEVLTT